MPYSIRWGPFLRTGVFTQGGKRGFKNRGEDHVKAEAEIGVMN